MGRFIGPALGADRFAVVLLLTLTACKRQRDPEVPFTPGSAVQLDGDLHDATGTAPVRPGPWEGEGLALYVPPGWSGSSGPRPRILHLEQAGTRYTFTVEAGDAPGNVDEDCYFDADGDFRTVPLLGVAQTRTCAGERWLRQSWWAEGLMVEVTWPLGSVVLGRQAVTPLLEGLRRADPGAPDSPAASPGG